MNCFTAIIFYNPLEIPWQLVPWCIIPLCISVGIIYKTLRCEDIARLPVEITKFTFYVIGGLACVCLAAVAIYHLFL